VGHFRAKFVEEGVDRCKPNFEVILERHDTVVCKRKYVDIFYLLSTMHKHDRQIDRRPNETYTVGNTIRKQAGRRIDSRDAKL